MDAVDPCGAIVSKGTEHWQSAVPTGAGHTAATAAFDVLMAGAVVTGWLVLAGIGLALPSMSASCATAARARAADGS